MVLVLGTGIAAARLFYPDVLDEGVQFADSLWTGGRSTPDATETPLSAMQQASAPTAVSPSPAMETVDPGDASTALSATVESVEPATEPAGTVVVVPGARMVGRSWEPYVTLWAYPGTSTGHLAVHRYEVSTLFEVIEPERSIGAYPVELDGLSWVRVQADDGLVGWVKASELEEAEETASR